MQHQRQMLKLLSLKLVKTKIASNMFSIYDTTELVSFAAPSSPADTRVQRVLTTQEISQGIELASAREARPLSAEHWGSWLSQSAQDPRRQVSVLLGQSSVL